MNLFKVIIVLFILGGCNLDKHSKVEVFLQELREITHHRINENMDSFLKIEKMMLAENIEYVNTFEYKNMMASKSIDRDIRTIGEMLVRSEFQQVTYDANLELVVFNILSDIKYNGSGKTTSKSSIFVFRNNDDLLAELTNFKNNDKRTTYTDIQTINEEWVALILYSVYQ